MSNAWQSIETAPKDGTEVLVWRKDAGALIAMYGALQDFISDEELDGILRDYGVGKESDFIEQEDWWGFGFFGAERLEGDLVPTHWMPLPKEEP